MTFIPIVNPVDPNSQILLDTALSTQVQGDSTPIAIADPQNRPGWYYNSTQQINTLEWKIFNGNNQEFTLGDVKNLTFTATHDNIPNNKCYMAITSPFSKIVFKNNDIELISGEKCLFYTNIVPSNPNMLRLVKLNLVTTTGPCDYSEKLMTITLEGTNVLQICVENIGYTLSPNIVPVIVNLSTYDPDIAILNTTLDILNTQLTTNSDLLDSNSLALTTNTTALGDSTTALEVNTAQLTDINTHLGYLTFNENDELLITGAVTVNTITGYALDTTLVSTNSKLDTISTTLSDINNQTNKLAFIDNNLQAVISNTGFDVNNQITGFATQATLADIEYKTNKLAFSNTSGINNLSVYDSVCDSKLDNVISNTNTLTDLSFSGINQNFLNTYSQGGIIDSITQLPTITINNFPETQQVAGSVSVSNLPDIQPVSGTVSVANFPSTQAVVGTVTVSTLPSIAITNTGFNVNNFPTTQAISGTVTVSTLPAINITNSGFDVNNQITGFATETSLSAIKTNTDKNKYIGDDLKTVISNTGFDVNNMITGFALESGGNLAGIKTNTDKNKYFGDDLKAVISNTGFNVNNFPTTQGVSGTVAVSSLPSIAIINTGFDVNNFPNTQVVSGTVAVSNIASTPLITGFSLDTTTQSTNTKLDIIHSDLDGLTYDGSSNLNVNVAAGSISVDSVNIKDSAGNNLTSTSGSLNSNITNTSIDTVSFGKTSGGVSKELLVNSSGELITESQIQDGSGNAITSTITSDTPTQKTGLDTASVIYSTVSGISNPITNTFISGKRGLDVNVMNTTAIPVSGSFYPATQPVSGSINIGSGTETAGVSMLGNDIVGGERGVNTASCLYARSNTILGLPEVALTCFTNGARAYLETRDEDANTNLTTINTSIGTTNSRLTTTNSTLSTINNKLLTTTNDYSTVGLNVYQIIPKTKTFNFNAFTTSTDTDAAIGSNSSAISFVAFRFGLANPRTWYAKIGGGSATDISLTYTYIDASGNEQNGSTGALTTAGVALSDSMITINSWKANKSLGSTDVVQIMAGANSGINSFVGGSLYQTNNALFTCPNNAIAWVQSVQFNANVADNLRLYKWDANGTRTVMFGWYGTANTQAYATGEYGFGGYITAGETIGWAGEVSTTRKNVYSNIVCRYL